MRCIISCGISFICIHLRRLSEEIFSLLPTGSRRRRLVFLTPAVSSALFLFAIFTSIVFLSPFTFFTFRSLQISFSYAKLNPHYDVTLVSRLSVIWELNVGRSYNFLLTFSSLRINWSAKGTVRAFFKSILSLVSSWPTIFRFYPRKPGQINRAVFVDKNSRYHRKTCGHITHFMAFPTQRRHEMNALQSQGCNPTTLSLQPDVSFDVSMKTIISLGMWQCLSWWNGPEKWRRVGRCSAMHQAKCIRDVLTRRRREYRPSKCNQIDACRNGFYGFSLQSSRPPPGIPTSASGLRDQTMRAVPTGISLKNIDELAPFSSYPVTFSWQSRSNFVFAGRHLGISPPRT